jgi:hypothetical protein
MNVTGEGGRNFDSAYEDLYYGAVVKRPKSNYYAK